MRSKAMLMQVKEAIISPKKQNKSKSVLIFGWKLTSSNAAFTLLLLLQLLFVGLSATIFIFNN